MHPSRRATAARRRLAVGLAVASAGVVTAAAGLAVLTSPSGSTGPASAGSVTPIAARATPAVSFVLPSLWAGRAPVALAGAEGRPVMLSFFASWCTGCQTELRTMAGVAETAGRNVRVIGVDVNDGTAPARSLLEQDGIVYPVGVDAGGRLSSEYGLVGLPTTVFLDRRHWVVGRTIGPLAPSVARFWLDRIGPA